MYHRKSQIMRSSLTLKYSILRKLSQNLNRQGECECTIVCMSNTVYTSISNTVYLQYSINMIIHMYILVSLWLSFMVRFPCKLSLNPVDSEKGEYESRRKREEGGGRGRGGRGREGGGREVGEHII